jgi:hypothetical protein
MVETTTLADLLALARQRLGSEAVLEFDSELVLSMTCPQCDQTTPVMKRMARLYESESDCPTCHGKREMHLTHRISGQEDFLNHTLAQVDVPPLGIVRARNGQGQVYYEMTGDKETFFSFF